MEYEVNHPLCGAQVKIKKRYTLCGCTMVERTNSYYYRSDIGVIVHPDHYMSEFNNFGVEFEGGFCESYPLAQLEIISRPGPTNIKLLHPFTFEQILSKNPGWGLINKLGIECEKRGRNLHWAWFGWNYIKMFHPSLVEYKDWLLKEGFIIDNNNNKRLLREFKQEFNLLLDKYNLT